MDHCENCGWVKPIEKKSHHKKESDIIRQRIIKRLKPKCLICHKKVGFHRSKFCSEKCAYIYNKTFWKYAKKSMNPFDDMMTKQPLQ